MLYMVVLTFESVDVILKCDHSNESYWAVLSCGTVYYPTQGDLTFGVCGWNPKVCDHSHTCRQRKATKQYFPVLQFFSAQRDSKFLVLGRNPQVFCEFSIWNVFVYETIQSNLLRTILLGGGVRSVFFNNNNRLSQISLTTCRSSDLLFSCRTTSSTCQLPQKSLIIGGLHELCKGQENIIQHHN